MKLKSRRRLTTLLTRREINAADVLWQPAGGGRRSLDQGAPVTAVCEQDERINAARPASEAALKTAGAKYQAFIYPGTQHGFNNDTTPRYNKEAAALAWQRTIDSFNKQLRTS